VQAKTNIGQTNKGVGRGRHGSQIEQSMDGQQQGKKKENTSTNLVCGRTIIVFCRINKEQGTNTTMGKELRIKDAEDTFQEQNKVELTLQSGQPSLRTV
jgi:hypothetical protein